MTISLTVQSAASDKPGAYRTDITITGSDTITQYLFVKERIVRPDGTVDDTFAAVASPEQIEDIPQQAPEPPSTFFRDNQVSFISGDPNRLNDVVNEVLSDLQLTVQQATDLQTFTTSTNYTISPSSITIVS